MTLYKWPLGIALRSLRTLAAVACTALVFLLAATQAVAQDKLDRIEWFAETGGSFFRLGQQPGVIQVPETSAFGLVIPPYQAIVVDSGRFSAARLDLTGIGYRLTSRDLIELCWSSSVNHFSLEPVPQGGRVTSNLERVPNVSFSYARYVGHISGWRPFVVAGIGVVWTNSVPSEVRRVEPSLDFGFGADHKLTDRLAFRFEVRDCVERLPSPLHGYSHDIAPTAGLVVSSRPAGPGTGGLSPIEIFLEGGGSFLTGGTIHTKRPLWARAIWSTRSSAAPTQKQVGTPAVFAFTSPAGTPFSSSTLCPPITSKGKRQQATRRLQRLQGLNILNPSSFLPPVMSVTSPDRAR
jgi:hypothetical protein